MNEEMKRRKIFTVNEDGKKKNEGKIEKSRKKRRKIGR